VKSTFIKLFALVPMVAGLFFATGCASMLTGHAGSMRVKVVDYKTGLPLPGVSAMWREDFDDPFFGHFQTGPTNTAPTDSSGMITITLVHPKMAGRLILNCPGYTTVYGTYTDGNFDTSDNIEPPPMPQELFMLDDAMSATMVGDYYLVRMHQ
jgi:hypothetical protein